MSGISRIQEKRESRGKVALVMSQEERYGLRMVTKLSLLHWLLEKRETNF